MPKTYTEVHAELRKTRGSAGSQVCSCGKPAAHWSYQYTGILLRSPEGSPYSENIYDYVPLCRSCHAALDWNDPVTRSRRMAGAGKIGSWTAEHARTDPGHLEILRTRGARLGEWVQEQCAAGIVATQKAGGRAVSKIERCCLDCGVVAPPGPMGVHLKHTSHSGWGPAT